VIVHTGGPTSITFGELDGQVTERAQRLLDRCQQAGFAAELSESIKTVLWAKLAFICAQAGMTAAVRLPIGEIRTVDAAWAAFQKLVAEVAAVAEADGTPLPPAAQQRALTLAQSVEPGSFSSLHDDLVAGRRMELRPCTAWWCGGRPSTGCRCRCRKRSTPSSSHGRSATSTPRREWTCSRARSGRGR